MKKTFDYDYKKICRIHNLLMKIRKLIFRDLSFIERLFFIITGKIRIKL